MSDDDYEHLGPNMRARLDAAELQQAKIRDWITLLAERGQQHYLIARELCLLLGYAAPRRPE